MPLDSPLSLASTNGARSRRKAEHVGHAQDFPPPTLGCCHSPALVRVQFLLGVYSCSGA